MQRSVSFLCAASLIMCASPIVHAGPWSAGIAAGNLSGLTRADHPARSAVFASDWLARHAVIDEGVLNLTLAACANRMCGASVRLGRSLGHGSYEATLKAAPGKGVVTGFFLYTGPAHGTHHDEIDFEFLGSDPKAVRLSLWVDGALRQRRVALGFDASKEFHRYRIIWDHDHVTWLIDDRQVLRLTRADGPLPGAPMRVFANIWGAGKPVQGWAGRYRGATAQAQFRTLRFVPLVRGQGQS